jgi:hypothetical protein
VADSARRGPPQARRTRRFQAVHQADGTPAEFPRRDRELVTPGNAIIIALCGYYGGEVSGFTVDESSVAFTKATTSRGYNAEIWAAYRVTAAEAVMVTVTATALASSSIPGRGKSRQSAPPSERTRCRIPPA